MNKESYFYLLWKSLWNSFSAFSLFLGLILPLVFWRLEYDTKIPLFWFVIIMESLLFLLTIFVRFSMILYDNRKQKAYVLAIMESYGAYKSKNNLIALTTYVDYFTENGIVSIFHLENECEKLIAIGQIINIQEDKKVQILVFNIDPKFSCKQLLNNNKDLLKKLLIKPIVKLNYLEEIRYGK